MIINAEKRKETIPAAVSQTESEEEIAKVAPAQPKIKEEDVKRAEEILQKYKQGKANLENKIIENEKWWKMRHWDVVGHNDMNRPEPTSAWLFNSIANKHADAMDNYPEPSVLPRALDDYEAAKQLTNILPVVLEQNNYEKTYSDTWWYKLKQGTGVKGIFWNQSKLGGLGDVEIKKIDLLNLFWEPGIDDIQESLNLFNVEIVDNEVLKSQYPDLKLGSIPDSTVKTYVHDDAVDTSNKSMVVDWYYKSNIDGKETLHYCKFCNGQVLYASENEEEYAERGYYDHGKYPFVFDTLFLQEGTPCGFGYIDVMKNCQMYIDKLDQNILENTLMTSKKRFFVRDDAGVNLEEYSDYNKTFVSASSISEDTIKEIKIDALPGICVDIRNNKIEELKETSGNRDFSQGGTANGVTAASAISALMEAGSKLSRDMLKATYRAFTEECYLVLELMRQFYDAPRQFRITGTGRELTQEDFISFDNSGIKPQPQGNEFGVELGDRMPIFDLVITAAKKSTYSRMSQNELALQFYQLGFFNPQAADQALSCLEMMDFDGKEKIVERVKQGQTMLMQMQQMQQQLQQFAMIIDAQNGTMIGQNVQGQGQMMMQEPQPGRLEQKKGSLQEQAVKKTQEATVPR